MTLTYVKNVPSKIHMTGNEIIMRSNKIKIIAEIASAHGGDIQKLKDLICISEKTGADFIKLQIFNVSLLLRNNDINKSDLSKIELSIQSWSEVLDFCKKNISTSIIIEPYDETSLDLALGNKFIAGIKIPASEVSNSNFIRKASKKNGLLMLSAGGSTVGEIENAFEIIKSEKNNYKQTVIMHGIQSFPTKIQDCDLHKIETIGNRFQSQIGFADHTDAEDVLGRVLIPLMAIAKGAKYIEKHITINRSEKGYDYFSALEGNEFIDFVNNIRTYIDSLGSEEIDILGSAEILYRNKMKRFCIIKSNIRKGEKFDTKKIIFRRTGIGGIEPDHLEIFCGKTYNKDYTEGTILSNDLFE